MAGSMARDAIAHSRHESHASSATHGPQVPQLYATVSRRHHRPLRDEQTGTYYSASPVIQPDEREDASISNIVHVFYDTGGYKEIIINSHTTAAVRPYQIHF